MGYVFALLAASLFGLNGALSKLIMEAGISPTQLTFFRATTVMSIAGVWLLFANRSAFRLTTREFWQILALGLGGVALLQWTYASSVALLPVGITLLLEYLAILAIAVIARVFFKEHVKLRLWIAIVIVFVGLALVAEIWNPQLNALGVAFGLAAAAALTIYFVLGEKVLDKISAMKVTFWSMGIAAAFWFFPSQWWTVDAAVLSEVVSFPGGASWLGGPVWLLILFNGAFGTFLPYLFSLLALRNLKATPAGIAASSEVFFAFVFAFLLIGESLTLVQIVGAVIVFIAVLLAQTARAAGPIDADGISMAMAKKETLP